MNITYEYHLKGNITHFGVSEIGNTVQLHWHEYVSKGYLRLYTNFCVISLIFVLLIRVLVCQKVVIDPPVVRYVLLSSF